MENLKKEEIEEIKSNAIELTEKVNTIIIRNQVDVQKVTVILKNAKNEMKTIKEKMSPIVKKAHEAHKAVKALENELLQPYKTIDTVLRGKISEYNRIEFEKVEKLRRKAEGKRLEAERKERERLNRLAEKALEKEKYEKAEELIERAESVIMPTIGVPKIETQVKNMSGAVEMTARKDFEVKIIDFDLFLNAIIDEKIPKNTVKILENEVKKYVKAFDLNDKQCQERGIKKTIVFKTIVR
jgi:hypothetical protein